MIIITLITIFIISPKGITCEKLDPKNNFENLLGRNFEKIKNSSLLELDSTLHDTGYYWNGTGYHWNGTGYYSRDISYLGNKRKIRFIKNEIFANTTITNFDRSNAAYVPIESTKEGLNSNSSIIKANSRTDSSRRCKCGKVQIQDDKIVGGRPTQISRYPYTVQILYFDFPYCGGTIINDKYVLTAAHCTDFVTPEDIHIRYAYTGPGSRSITANVKSIRVHERWKSSDISKFDISLVKIQGTFVFSRNAQPACLSRRLGITNKRGTITGWGDTSSGGSTSDVLLAATVLIVDYKECRKVSDYPNHLVGYSVVCGTGKNVDTCQGDSGGPLVYFSRGSYFLAGITSWGAGCADEDYPGIYTHVAVYYKWILKRTGDAVYCKP